MVQIKHNQAKHGIELYFDTKPGADIRDALKACKWRWHPRKCCWYNWFNDDNVKFAQSLADGDVPIVTDTGGSAKDEIGELLIRAWDAACKARDEKHAEIYNNPAPHAVVQHENQFDDSSPIEKVWKLHDLCGFAWIHFSAKGANKRLLSYIKKHSKCNGERYSSDKCYLYKDIFSVSKSYSGGFNLYLDYGGQEISIKRAMHGAFAQVLNDAGYDVFVRSRLD